MKTLTCNLLLLQPFMMLKVTVENFLEQGYHNEFQYQVVSTVVTIDYVPILVLVRIDLQLRFFVDVVFVNVHFQLQFIKKRKLRKIFVALLQMDCVFVQSASQNRRILGFAIECVVYFQLGWQKVTQIFHLKEIQEHTQLAFNIIVFFIQIEYFSAYQQFCVYST